MCFFVVLFFWIFCFIYFLRGKKRNLFSSNKRKKSDYVAKLEEYLLSSCGLFARRYLGLEKFLIFVFVLTFCFHVIDQFAVYHFFLSTGN